MVSTGRADVSGKWQSAKFELPSYENWPCSGHEAHVIELVAPIALENLPNEQSAHASCPASWYEPAGQGSHWHGAARARSMSTIVHMELTINILPVLVAADDIPSARIKCERSAWCSALHSESASAGF